MRPITTASTTLTLLFMSAAPAIAGTGGTGGLSATGKPAIAAVTCIDGRVAACGRGDSLTVSGDDLQGVRRVVFLGRRGKQDDRAAKPSKRAQDRVVVTVPRIAHTGPLRVIASSGTTTGPRVRVSPAPPTTSGSASQVLIGGSQPARFVYPAGAPGRTVQLVRGSDGAIVTQWPAQPEGGAIEFDGLIAGAEQAPGPYAMRVSTPGAAAAVAGAPILTFTLLDFIFPIRGKHDLGQTATNGFGGGRGHQGQDMFATCGTPIVAARGGTILKAAYDGRGGNYAVIKRPDGQSYVYMHMRKPALVAEGETVVTGQPLGEVGETGRASGCHLHFELWTAPGWYLGGKAIDPLPELTRWDAQS